MSSADESATVNRLDGSFLVAPRPERPVVKASAPTFAVAIAAYQAGAYVVEAVLSALAQTLPAHEVIVCDDGSTDATAEKVAEFGERVLLLRQEHRGVAAAKNACVEAASASFVMILDADNILLPDCLRLVAQAAIARPDLDIVTTDAYLEIDGRVYDRYYRKKARFITTNQRLGVLHQHFIYGQAAVRRSRITAVGGYDERLSRGVDTDLFLRLVLTGSHAGLVLEPLSRYRLREGSLSSSRAQSLRAMVTILERISRNRDGLLSDEERRFLEQDLAVKQQLTALVETESALRSRAPEARAAALAIARNRPGPYAASTRAKATIAALAPTFARQLLALRERRSGQSRLAHATRGR